jgi:SPP1 gp7 family putative phage head morphogenesis protein
VARVGAWDITLNRQAWFDVNAGDPLEGFLDKVAIGRGGTPPPPPPVVIPAALTAIGARALNYVISPPALDVWRAPRVVRARFAFVGLLEVHARAIVREEVAQTRATVVDHDHVATPPATLELPPSPILPKPARAKPLPRAKTLKAEPKPDHLVPKPPRAKALHPTLPGISVAMSQPPAMVRWRAEAFASLAVRALVFTVPDSLPGIDVTPSVELPPVDVRIPRQEDAISSAVAMAASPATARSLDDVILPMGPIGDPLVEPQETPEPAPEPLARPRKRKLRPQVDPIKARDDGWQWGSIGKVWKTKEQAMAEMNELHGSNRMRADKAARAAIKHWGASKAAEARYVQSVLQIMAAAHKGILQVVEREHLADMHADAANKTPPAGLGSKLLQKTVTWMKPRIQTAFDFMAKDVDKKATQAAELYGVHVRHVAGVDAAIETARTANVELITNATGDFLDQVRDILDEMEGEPADSIREALEERVGVSNSRGALIARDQTLRLNSQIAEHRQRSAGVRKYTWVTAGDERVRPGHAELDGEVIEWDDPPVVDDDGTRAHAGRDFQCRCVPAAYVDELEGEEGGDEPDEDE